MRFRKWNYLAYVGLKLCHSPKRKRLLGYVISCFRRGRITVLALLGLYAASFFWLLTNVWGRFCRSHHRGVNDKSRRVVREGMCTCTASIGVVRNVVLKKVFGH